MENPDPSCFRDTLADEFGTSFTSYHSSQVLMFLII